MSDDEQERRRVRAALGKLRKEYEEIRKEYHTCPGCGCDLGGFAELLERCPLCGWCL